MNVALLLSLHPPSPGKDLSEGKLAEDLPSPRRREGCLFRRGVTQEKNSTMMVEKTVLIRAEIRVLCISNPPLGPLSEMAAAVFSEKQKVAFRRCRAFTLFPDLLQSSENCV